MMQPGGPGWNDPPQLSHKTHSETKSRRNVLNKRVAYLDHPPLINSKNTLTSTPHSDLPPVNSKFIPTVATARLVNSVSSTSPTPVKIFNPNLLETCSTSRNDNVTLKPDDPLTNEKILIQKDFLIDINNFDTVDTLILVAEHCSTDKNSNVYGEIAKKLDILRNAFRDEVLSENVKIKMKDMTKHILLKQYQQAWDLHIAMMCDHVSEVRSWMVGIKRLISELRKQEG